MKIITDGMMEAFEEAGAVGYKTIKIELVKNESDESNSVRFSVYGAKENTDTNWSFEQDTLEEAIKNWEERVKPKLPSSKFIE